MNSNKKYDEVYVDNIELCLEYFKNMTIITGNHV
jgi:hypothetical protein